MSAASEVNAARPRYGGSTANRFSRNSASQSLQVMPANTPGPHEIKNRSRQVSMASHHDPFRGHALPRDSQRTAPAHIAAATTRRGRAAPVSSNFGLDELREQCQRFLPAEIASLGGNHVGHACLHDL